MKRTVVDTCPRVPVRSTTDEHTMSSAILDYQRETFLCKASGLSEADGWRALPPTNMSLLGIMKHMTISEQMWFRFRFDEPPGSELVTIYPWDDCWAPAPGETPAGILARYQQEVAHSRAIIAAHSLDAEAPNPPPVWDEALTLRWVMFHMIEEVSRHNGHADLLREAIDGEVGY